MIADALIKNKTMKLKEFYASRDRLEQDGMEALSKVIQAQQSLQKIEVTQNGSKLGLRYLLQALATCKELTEININDNMSINKAIP